MDEGRNFIENLIYRNVFLTEVNIGKSVVDKTSALQNFKSVMADANNFGTFVIVLFSV